MLAPNAMPSSFIKSKRGTLLLLVATFAALAVVLPTIASLYVDLLWFRSLKLPGLFVTMLGAKFLLGCGIGLLAFALFYANGRLAIWLSAGLHPVFLRDPNGAIQVNLGNIVTKALWPTAIVAGLLSGLSSAAHWDTFLLALNATPFGTSDPIFGKDVGYYVFRLPLLQYAASMAFGLLIPALMIAGIIYAGRGGLTLRPRLHMAHKTRIHLSILAAAVFAVLAYEAHLSIANLLFSNTGPVAGASYTDVHARLPALRLKVIAAAIGSILLCVHAVKERLPLASLAIGLYLAVDILGVRVYPSVVQKFSVIPNEYDKESRFIEYNIKATREAFNLAAVTERELSAEAALTKQDIEENRDTIENIRLWDHGPLLDTFAQIQEIRTYYDFTSVDNDRYIIDNKLRQTMLSPRELSSDSLPNRTWINERFTFTHGYGLTLGPVNQATPEGLPVLFVQDIPPKSTVETLNVSEPAIYYGELSNDYVFVHTKNREFHHPTGEESVFSSYKGGGGIVLDSILTKLSLALHFGSIKLLLSDDIHAGSRALLFRNIMQRVRKIAPFFTYDADPYLVIRDDGSLVWIIDAYTQTNRYPFSQPSSTGVNYIRNAVKVVVNAYDGGVTFYIADDADPILKTWMKIFPGALQPLAKMPKDIRAHLRYPIDIFDQQTEMFTVYHMTSAELVYNREDQWEIPAITSGETRKTLEPYYTVMKLPEENKPEFILMLPFTPKRKDNLAAWLVARNDGDHLGELVVYGFPKDRLVFGPQQIANRINQEAEIARQISLWDQRGSQAILGTLLVIPIEESLIYVQPLYLRSQGGRIPELKRVVVAYENSIAMEPTLDGALARLFPGADTLPIAPAKSGPPGTPEAKADATAKTPPEGSRSAASSSELAEQARQHYLQAVRAQRDGHWAQYGEELRKLGELLEQMQ